jgi:hemoglobin
VRSSSLYEHAGGAEALLRLARAHHARCLADPVLNHPFSHAGHPQHVERLALYWGEVFGGPAAELDESEVLGLHAGVGEVGDLGDRFLACFVAALDDAGLPADEEFRAAVTAYMRWACDRVVALAPVGSVVPQREPVPRWGWDGRA